MKNWFKSQNNTFRFRSFNFDRETMQLAKHKNTIPIGKLPPKILDVLISRSGNVVTREEIKSIIWPDSERIDTERRLNTAIRVLRDVLQDTAENPQFIETIRGVGYRWIEPLKNQRFSSQLTGLAPVAIGYSFLFAAGFAFNTFISSEHNDVHKVEKVQFVLDRSMEPQQIAQLLNQMIQEKTQNGDQVRIRTSIAQRPIQD